MKGIDTMHLDNMKEILNSLNTDEIATLIKLANEEKQVRDVNKEKKYMDAIRKAINDYLDNVGELAFNVEYEDEDGCDASTTVYVNTNNPPACDTGTIWL